MLFDAELKMQEHISPLVQIQPTSIIYILSLPNMRRCEHYIDWSVNEPVTVIHKLTTGMLSDAELKMQEHISPLVQIQPTSIICIVYILHLSSP